MRKVFKQCIVLVMNYGAETLTHTRTTVHKLQVSGRIMKRIIIGGTMRKRILNSLIRKRPGLLDVINNYVKMKLG